MIEIPDRMLVVVPHPDDAEIACGGTVAKWIEEGAQACYLICSDGGKGTDDPGLSPVVLAGLRKDEQLKAAALLGVNEVVHLGYPDGELEDTRQFRRSIVRIIRQFRPQVVICPDPFKRSFYFHRDHRITGQVTMDAVFPYARDRLHFPELESEGIIPHKVGTIMFWGSDEPDYYVDISKTIDIKIEALGCHKSQVSGLSDEDSVRWLRDWSKEVGSAAGYPYAESFRIVRFRI